MESSETENSNGKQKRDRSVHFIDVLNDNHIVDYLSCRTI